MKITNTMCHSHLLWMLSQPAKFERAVYKYSATSPAYQHEGMAGYIETEVTFEISDLQSFTALYFEYHNMDTNTRSNWYFNI